MEPCSPGGREKVNKRLLQYLAVVNRINLQLFLTNALGRYSSYDHNLFCSCSSDAQRYINVLLISAI